MHMEMDKKKIKLPINTALTPVFYQRFHCLAQDCRDSCCINWRITFNKKDYLRLRRLDAPPELRRRLDQGVCREKKRDHDGVFYGKFDLDGNSGRCPFLDPDGLCSIQRACGHSALPKVCTGYPRSIKYTPAAKEYALSPSCEGVLQQLWDLPEGVEFVEDPLPKAEWRNANITPGEEFLQYFAPVRGVFIDILQNRTAPLTERLLCLGIAIQRLQEEDWTAFDPEAWAVRMAALSGERAAVAAGIPGNRRMFLAQNLNVLAAIEGKNEWISEIYRTLNVKRQLQVEPQKDGSQPLTGHFTTNYSENAYVEALERFHGAFDASEYFFENLMVASALYLNFPHLDSKEALWKSYVALCSLYSLYRFVCVAGCREDTSKERLFHMIVMASRATLHSRDRFNGFQEDLFKHESSTLAHMAILLRWDL